MAKFFKIAALSKSTIQYLIPRKLHAGISADKQNSDLIFSVPKIVSFCSQGTTLKPGTIILTGTPAGVGHSCSPKEYLREGDEFAVEILPHIGTMTTIFENAK